MSVSRRDLLTGNWPPAPLTPSLHRFGHDLVNLLGCIPPDPSTGSGWVSRAMGVAGRWLFPSDRRRKPAPSGIASSTEANGHRGRQPESSFQYRTDCDVVPRAVI